MINKWADCSKGDFNAIFAIFMEYVASPAKLDTYFVAWYPSWLWFASSVASTEVVDTSNRNPSTCLPKKIKKTSLAIPQSWWIFYWENQPNHLKQSQVIQAFVPVQNPPS